MSKNLVLYGFDGNTYVRSVRLILANKRVDYELVEIKPAAGEHKRSAYLARNPLGRVPVIDHDGFWLYETSAIARYLDDVMPGPAHTPGNPADRARMNMAMGIVDADGYDALITVSGQHLFPDIAGGSNDKVRKDPVADSRQVLSQLMKLRGNSPFIAGDRLSIADCYLAPLCACVSVTSDADEVFDVDGFDDWWQRLRALPCYRRTESRPVAPSA